MAEALLAEAEAEKTPIVSWNYRLREKNYIVHGCTRVWRTKHQLGGVDYEFTKRFAKAAPYGEGFEHLFPTDPVSLKNIS